MERPEATAMGSLTKVATAIGISGALAGKAADTWDTNRMAAAQAVCVTTEAELRHAIATFEVDHDSVAELPGTRREGRGVWLGEEAGNALGVTAPSGAWCFAEAGAVDCGCDADGTAAPTDPAFLVRYGRP
jgi:hypothetical protein